MRRLRDVFYVNSDLDKNRFVYYGMEFHEFIKAVPDELQNLLLLSAGFLGDKYHAECNLFGVEGKEKIEELALEDIYGLGDFAWVDYRDSHADENVVHSGTESLTPREVADLLYLGHVGEPVQTPFFDKLGNRYVYLAHDDGWYCRLYCRHNSDFRSIMSNKIVNTVSTSKKRKIYSISEEIGEKLLELSQDGLLVDFSKMYKDTRRIEIPVYVIGKINDMDTMYNNLERHKARASVQMHIVHADKQWKLY